MVTIHCLVLVTVLVLLLPSTASSLCRAPECGPDADAMATLAFFLNPIPPKWSAAPNQSSAYCDWYGVTCNDSGYVSSIDLNSSNLYGPLPSGFPPLPKLRLLSFGVNFLDGPVPLLHNLTSLRVLDLVGNRFTTMPMEFFEGLSPTVVFLQLGFNYFLDPWSIPTQLSRLINLKEFYAHQSNIVGTLPDVFQSCPLEHLQLSKNRLVGSLPPSMAKSNLSELILDSQEVGFSGSIEVLSKIQSLQYLYLTNNKFTGPVPDFSNCKSLSVMTFGNNKLTGVVPNSLDSLRSLSALDLSNNSLQGPFPYSLSKKQRVALNNNNFCTQTGRSCDPQVTTLLQIAAAFGYPFKLSESWVGNDACNKWSFVKCNSRKEIMDIDFTNQHFNGTISSAFANLKALQYLQLSGNNLTGSIPSSLADLSGLLELDVSYNNLSGKIPPFKSTMKLNTTGNPLLGSLGSSRGGKRRKKLIIFIAVLSVLTTIASAIFVLHFKRITRDMTEKVKPDKLEKQYADFLDFFVEKENWVKVREIHTISFQKLAAATNNFNQENKLGEGGFGSVYKGRFQDGQEVAVKRLSNASGQGVEEFMNEVTVISKVQHRNLVKLVGFCITKEEKMLVYEYLPNKSLDAFLFDPQKRKVLDWRRRFNIIEGICRGLLYLHRDSRPRIIHRDLKASNILLDEEFNPKISDFGMARTFGANEDQVNTKRIVGTIGYMPREYAMDGRFSEKSDVFSLGVLVLEIISGRRNTSFHNNESSLSLLEHAWKLWNEGEILALMDPEIANPSFKEEIFRCTQVSLLCVQDLVKDRPTVPTVISMLSSELENLPTPNQPSFLEPKAIEEQKCSINNVTITNLLPR